MKFRQIKMTNFMRYKGENKLLFSTDPEKNVTVVLGNNTFGKTTIAQAFRWGLYGNVIDTQYTKGKDTNLLNNEILAQMGPNDRKLVSVEIQIEDGQVVHEFVRKAEFIRKGFGYTSKQISEKLLYRTREDGAWSDYREGEEVQDRVQLMFPRELSSYFLFDGERWNNEADKTKDIKDAINTIMGISPLSYMKYHLKDRRGKSVIRLIRNSFVAESESEMELNRKINDYEAKIVREEEKIRESKELAENRAKKVAESEEILRNNKKTEDMLQDLKREEHNMERSNRLMENYYKDIVNGFSDSYKYFSASLLEQVVTMLKNSPIEGSQIPDLTGATIDYLLEMGQCLCGHPIEPDSPEYKKLEELKKVIYPESIATFVNSFQGMLETWRGEGKKLYDEILEKADLYEGEKQTRDDSQEEIDRINKKIDRTINFEQERRKMESNRVAERQEREKIRIGNINIEGYKEEIKKLEQKLDESRVHTEQNLKRQRMVAYAEALYDRAEAEYQKRQSPLLGELNELMKRNFSLMFNEQEKEAALEEDYKLHLYYKRIGQDGQTSRYEEKVLSEGEQIARNFVFIVSILELAKQKKEEAREVEDNYVLNLPLVLDGPFSKLSDDNIGLIAKVLPTVSEQVIIFMLDKDWEATNLSQYTDATYTYRVTKEQDANSSSIERCKEA